jgi:isopenicillin-N N-acyltransferase-like protein
MFHECPQVREPYPPMLLEHARTLLAEIAVQLRLHPSSLPAALLARQRYPEHAAQIDDAAQLLGVDPLDLTMANLSYDLFLGLFGCSTVVLATPEGPFVARNMDWPMSDRIARASCVVPLENGVHAGAIGATGVVSGQSKHGFTVILNAALAGELDQKGYPVLLFLRHLMDTARSFDEAVELASRTRLTSGALITLAGVRNEQRVCVERTPRAHQQRRPHGDEPLLVTNHYRRLASAHVCPRYEFLSRHLRHHLHPGSEELLALLNDANVRQDITAQHILASPSRAMFRLFVPAELLKHDQAGDDFDSMRKLF